MSENLPAIREHTAELGRVVDTDSWTEVVGEVAKLASYISETEFVPRGLRGSAPATAAAVLYGREIGLGPMTSLAGISVVDGRPTLAAELLRAQVFAAGHEIVYVKTTGGICEVKGKRRGSEHWTTVEWTLDMARAAGLADKKNWKSYPRAMLVARATAELCRLIFPDVTHGMSATEELDGEPSSADSPEGSAATGSAARTTVRRKASQRRTKGDDGAEAPAGGPPPAESTAVKSTPPAPSSPPMPPLPGEPGATVDRSGGSNRAPHPGSTDGARRDDTGSGSNVPGRERDEAEGAAGAPADPGPGRVEPAEASAGEETPAAPDVQPCELTTPHEQHTHQAFDGPPYLCRGIRAEPVEDEDRPRMMSRGAQRAMFAAFNSLGITDDAARLYATSAIIGRPVASSNELTAPEGNTLMETLNRCQSREELLSIIAATEQAAGDPPGPDEGA